MKIGYITNASEHSGIGYRVTNIQDILAKQSDISLSKIAFPQKLPFAKWPGVLGSKTINWIRWGRKIRPTDDIDLYHCTNQSLAFLAKRLRPSVVTVHDIIELLEPQTGMGSFLHQYLYSGISKSTQIIAVSEYTKKTIIDHYGIRSSRISVIPNGVGKEFHPINDLENTVGYQEIRRELKLSDKHPLILYVGSDHPRKNLTGALEVFSHILKRRPDAIFLKVGSAGIASGRKVTFDTIDQLKLREHVRFVSDVSNEKLNLLYNISDVLLYPTRFEGFGLPPLQAMAAGLPVVTSNVTSLPEVVGDAALTSDPDDTESLMHQVQRITEDRTSAAEYRRRGIARAQLFTWKKSADQVIDVYRKVIGK